MDPKGFSQRRPDPSKPDGWVWKLGRTKRYLYHLPDLLAAASETSVFIVEGEKDVDRLRSIGAVATTNPQGATKWRDEYSQSLAGRHVVIIPDNDPADTPRLEDALKGQKHAMLVAASVYRVAESVKVLELPGLPDKGDVSDWLDAGGTLHLLMALVEAAPFHTDADPYRPAGMNYDAEPLAGSSIIWLDSKYRPISQKFIAEGLLQNGYFIAAEGRFYYFDNRTKTVSELDTFQMKSLLNEVYGINSTETFYKFLAEDMKVETHVRGKPARLSTFAHYAPQENLLFLNLGKGAMLKLDGDRIQTVDNGSGGVLFTQGNQEPWNFIPDPRIRLIGDTLIRPMNFVTGEGAPHTGEEQQLLLLIWMLSIAFETVQPTKPLALALGPAGSGKTSMFRRIGRMLYGESFEVDGIRKDGEEDFFVTTTNNPLAAFDNVDKYVPWLEDALATSATGMKITKKVLYTTNEAISYTPRAFIALTARTPHFRRDDVSERVLPFRLDRIVDKRPEYELLREVVDNRDRLMSEYAHLLNKVVAVNHVPKWQMGLRLADFAQVALRIGAGLDRINETKKILKGLQTSQHLFATEENDLVMLLDLWTRSNRNNGTETLAKDLYRELKELADAEGYKWTFKSPTTLGRQMDSIREPMSVQFEIHSRHTKRGNAWTFTRISDSEDEVVI